jgi:hypothetical protein
VIFDERDKWHNDILLDKIKFSKFKYSLHKCLSQWKNETEFSEKQISAKIRDIS